MRTRVALILAAASALTACAADPPAPAPPKTLAVFGTITVPGGVTEQGLDGGPGQTCVMDGGYSDIRQGAQVVVSDEKGTTIAIGNLGEGTLDLPNLQAWGTRSCVFPFLVKAPAGRRFYGVEVSHRGRLQYTEAQLAEALRLTLGS
ncbi:hypothetical protein [Microbispora sp. KK1-11]|uniref:hypothetical protein n=1 Tax=Microbispora sp. KK1-11 TaxID=2053005 RepID=UPI001158580F|nr:hypothetical protein [Microbispora sp. KK1-11]TQS29098.1 hypothetical protein FLW16_12185 [Microbispora sp. KK1-11]